MKSETIAIHGGYPKEHPGHSSAIPVFRTSAYDFNSATHAANLFALKELGHIYSRISNPTQQVLEERMALLEGGKAALALSSGTSAVFYAIINICEHGDEVVAANNLYGGTYAQFTSILPQFGITVRMVDPSDPENFRRAITSKTRAIYCETLGNPALNMTDIAAVADIAHNAMLPLIVDATFTPPTMLRPIEHGADVVIHSLTKWLGGHGTGLGGIVVDAGNFNWRDEKFTLYNRPDQSYHGLRYAHDLGDLNPIAFALRMRLVPLRNLGACIAPDNAWLFLQGIETLALRMERHSANGQAVADYLAAHKDVEWVNYPGLTGSPGHDTAVKYLTNGFGGMVSFGIRGGRDAGRTFIEQLAMFSHVANVGDAKSLAIHPASTTHSQLSEEQLTAGGISDSLVRLSIGIEHIDDIIADLDQAIAKACRP